MTTPPPSPGDIVDKFVGQHLNPLLTELNIKQHLPQVSHAHQIFLSLNLEMGAHGSNKKEKKQNYIPVWKKREKKKKKKKGKKKKKKKARSQEE